MLTHHDALKALPKNSQKKPGMVQMAISKIAKLYAIEKQIKPLNAEQRYLIRRKKANHYWMTLKSGVMIK
ncbi:hypothetical protein [sulfur-oxidizing endosymbiont of Gigantopelta aegis]|uniref:hypothetical protein n=1 Tax=sulfur-oxidizing endosymbiont of Gigantopelta aegis TaxID=2794934 RepID=UPI0018DCDC32|nr:hypothetical protein [sulfur-oxidizing endosymbiont of Gigantopelta aegis]